MTPDAMEALRWAAAVAVGCTVVAICAVYVVALGLLIRFLCQESGQEEANAWEAVYEDYEGPQEDSRGAGE